MSTIPAVATPATHYYQSRHKRPGFLPSGINFCPAGIRPLESTAGLCIITVFHRAHIDLPWIVRLDFRAAKRLPNTQGWLAIGQVAWQGLGVYWGKEPIHETLKAKHLFAFATLRHASKAAKRWKALIEQMSATGFGLQS
jgi:hypothetical protein